MRIYGESSPRPGPDEGEEGSSRYKARPDHRRPRPPASVLKNHPEDRRVHLRNGSSYSTIVSGSKAEATSRSDITSREPEITAEEMAKKRAARRPPAAALPMVNRFRKRRRRRRAARLEEEDPPREPSARPSPVPASGATTSRWRTSTAARTPRGSSSPRRGLSRRPPDLFNGTAKVEVSRPSSRTREPQHRLRSAWTPGDLGRRRPERHRLGRARRREWAAYNLGDFRFRVASRAFARIFPRGRWRSADLTGDGKATS